MTPEFVSVAPEILDELQTRVGEFHSFPLISIRTIILFYMKYVINEIEIDDFEVLFQVSKIKLYILIGLQLCQHYHDMYPLPLNLTKPSARLNQLIYTDNK